MEVPHDHVTTESDKLVKSTVLVQESGLKGLETEAKFFSYFNFINRPMRLSTCLDER